MREIVGNVDQEMRQRGPKNPLTLTVLTAKDKELIPDGGMKMRERTAQNHDTFVKFPKKVNTRNVVRNTKN
jgi:hypothetical protein